MILSKEEMALEALIQITTILCDPHSGGVGEGSIIRAKEAMKANGWEIYHTGAFGMASARKIECANA